MSAGLTFDEPWLLLLLPAVVAAAFWAQRRGRRFLAPWRLATVRVLRPLALALLVLALAGLTVERREERLTVVFAVDGSRSVGGTGHPEAVRWLAEAADRIPEGDSAGVVAFGRDAMVDTYPTESFRVAEVLARPDDGATDLGAAVRLARGLFPPRQEARLVLLSDGVETRGSVERTIDTLPPEVDVAWAPLEPPPAAEVLVEQVSVPERVVEGEPHRVRVVVRSSGETRATLRLFRGATPVAASAVKLEPGRSQVFTFEQTAAPGSGVLLYRAEIEAVDDAAPENNRAAALVEVDGRPTVLAIDREPAALAAFVRALESSEMGLEVGGPGALPADVRGLAAYDTVVLSDVAATHFSEPQMRALATWVEDLGGGLVMLGGPESFGRGGYWKTPVEEVLPVSMEVKDRSYFPSVGLVLCLDKSGSMAGAAVAGEQKLEMAKAAAAEVLSLLHEMDRIGVVAFDAAAKWVVPMSSAADRDAVLARLGTMRPGGGTDAYPAMDLAFEALKSTETRVKHVILLTDGQLSARNHEGLAGAMSTEGVTVSTVGVGTDADLFTLERIAVAGGGAFYHAEDLASLPRIFLRDAFRVARSWVVEETFEPVRLGFHPVLAGFDALPALDAYVAAVEKPRAQHLLGTHHGDPLLSLWRVGLGKSVAFTSDVKARWAGRWLGWTGYEPFWAGLVRWTMRDPSRGRLSVSASASDGRLRLAADLLDGDGAFVNGASLVARVIGPDSRPLEVPMTQEGPGRYVGEAPAPREGPYLAAVTRRDEGPPGERGVAALVSAVVPYADEFRGVSAAPDGLERLVASGRVKKLGSAEEIFAHRGSGGRIARPLAPWLIGLAAVLLVTEVAVRKLAAPAWLERRLEVRRGRKEARVAGPPPTEAATAGPEVETGPAEPSSRKDEGPPPEVPPAGRDAYTSRLLEAKKRLRRGR